MNIINEIKKSYEIIINNNSIHIINYSKILDISYYSITISFTNKNVKFIGKELMIRKLDEKELIIDGYLKGIEFNYE